MKALRRQADISSKIIGIKSRRQRILPAADTDSAVKNVFCGKKQPKAYNKAGNWRNEPQYFSKRQHNKHCRTDKGKYAKSNDAAFAEKICTYKDKKSAA